MQRVAVAAALVFIVIGGVAVRAQDRETPVPSGESLQARVLRLVSPPKGDPAPRALTETTCSGPSGSFDTLTVCNDLTLLDQAAELQFEADYPKLTSAAQFGGVYYDGRIEYYGSVKALFATVRAFEGIESASCVLQECGGEYRLQGDTGRLGIGFSDGAYCFLEAFDPTVPGSSRALLYQQTDGAAGTATVLYGALSPAGGEGEGEGEGEYCFEGLMASGDADEFEVRLDCAAGSGAVITAGGSVEFKLGNVE